MNEECKMRNEEWVRLTINYPLPPDSLMLLDMRILVVEDGFPVDQAIPIIVGLRFRIPSRPSGASNPHLYKKATE